MKILMFWCVFFPHLDAVCTNECSDDDSTLALPPSQSTDDALSDELWPPLDVGIKPVGANEDDNAVPENSMPPLDGRWQQDPLTNKQENPGLEDPPPLSTSCSPQETEMGHLRPLDPVAERRVTQLRGRHESDSPRFDLAAVQRSGWQDFEKLHSIRTGKDPSGPA